MAGLARIPPPWHPGSRQVWILRYLCDGELSVGQLADRLDWIFQPVTDWYDWVRQIHRSARSLAKRGYVSLRKRPGLRDTWVRITAAGRALREQWRGRVPR